MLGRDVPHVPLITGHVQILDAVVVVVPEPSRKALHRQVHAKVRPNIIEGPVAIVAVKPVRTAEVRHVQVRIAVLVVVPPCHGFREVIIRNAGLARDVGERSVAFVPEELAGEVLISDIQVQVPVEVKVRPPRSLGGVVDLGQPRRQCHVAESARSVVAQQRVRIRPSDVFEPSPPHDEHVYVAVIVVVGLNHVQAAEEAGQTSLFRPVHEMAAKIPEVPHLSLWTPVRDQHVKPAIAVKVIRDYTAAEADGCKSHLGGHVPKRPCVCFGREALRGHEKALWNLVRVAPDCHMGKVEQPASLDVARTLVQNGRQVADRLARIAGVLVQTSSTDRQNAALRGRMDQTVVGLAHAHERNGGLEGRLRAYPARELIAGREMRDCIFVVSEPQVVLSHLKA